MYALWKKTDHAGHATQYVYDAGGLLLSQTRARNLSKTYTYLQSLAGGKLPGSVTGIDYSDATPDVSLTYRWPGELSQVTDAAGKHILGKMVSVCKILTETVAGMTVA